MLLNPFSFPLVFSNKGALSCMTESNGLMVQWPKGPVDRAYLHQAGDIVQGQQFAQQPDNKATDMSLISKFLSHIKIDHYLNDTLFGSIVGGCFSIGLI